jgi:hypothetical protein
VSFSCSALRAAQASHPNLISIIVSRQIGSTRNQICAYALLSCLRLATVVGAPSVGSTSSQNSSMVRKALVSLLHVCQFCPLSFVIDARIVLFEDMIDYGGRYDVMSLIWCRYGGNGSGKPAG